MLGAGVAEMDASAGGGPSAAAAAQGPEVGGEPMFMRRGASCSGVEVGTVAVAAVGASRLRASMARRASYAGEISPADSAAAPMMTISDEGPLLLRPSASLRPSPQQRAPLQPSCSLLRHQQAAVAAIAAPPQQLLLPSPSMLRAQQKPSASGVAPAQLLLSSSPSLLRAGQQPPTAAPACEPLRLPPPVDAAAPQVLKHNPSSFSRNVTTTVAVAALTLKQAPSMARGSSMARGNALPPMVTAPTPAEAAAALNRLASIQMLHRQKLLEAPGAQAEGQPPAGGCAVSKESSRGSGAAADGGRASGFAPVAPAAGSGEEGDEAEMVADLPTRPALADTRDSDGSSGSVEAPVRRAVSCEPAKPDPAAHLPRAVALSETGDGAAAAQPYMAKRWLDALQAPSCRHAGGPPPIEPIPEPEISAGSLTSAFDVARPAPVSSPLPGAVDSFKCLLREIEPCTSSRLGKPAPAAGWEQS
ncbi:hypothetical protein TSOC_010603 [Tetrabaena socialis]|uniref:Uncharacterized protein n=1 Tax=Tetrabaena socialis TaxID=47790 RepID=A0A2J7ZSY2_9CHLO|nr:hypothetical protein TSOC_010603 [Tetrabaena socialis]|eukprot:PNH03375.1 hypothetical protein TSOC_010603 [Tetrabaena socialis]